MEHELIELVLADTRERMAKAIVEATTHHADPEIVAKVSRGLGDAMRGLEIATVETTFADRGW